MKKYFLLLIPAMVCFFLFFHTSASAQSTFNQNDIMDDAVFNNGAMNAGQINTWLNANFPSSCISTNNGFSAPDPTGYSPSGGFTYGANVSGGQVIYDAAGAYGINPEVLLVTLEKEQSLISGGDGCSVLRYTGAAGYGCPDGGNQYNYSGVDLYSINGNEVSSVSGTCVDNSLAAGFSEQVIHAAWLLEFGMQRSEGNISWDVQKTNSPESGDTWNNSDDPQTCYGGPMTAGTWQVCPNQSGVFYSGTDTIDGTTVQITNGATAALYWYTPHFHGNENFDSIFNQWFGTQYDVYAWQPVSQAIYTDSSESDLLGWGATLTTGESAYAVIIAANTGDVTWTNTGPNPIQLGTFDPSDRASPFANGSWLGYNRPTTLMEASVAPGQWGEFAFPITAPGTLGNYNEHFNLLAANLTWLNDPGQFFTITVSPQTFTWKPVSQAIYTDPSKNDLIGWGATLTAGNSAYAVIIADNTSDFTWTQTGATAVELGTSQPNDRASPFANGSWPGYNRAALLMESSVGPGQWGVFEFPITAPNTPGSYNEHFNLVSSSWFTDPGQSFPLTVLPKAFTWQPVSQAIYTNSSQTTLLGWGATLTPSESAYAVVIAANTGNVTWTNTGANQIDFATDDPTDRASPFCNSNWLGCPAIAATLMESSVAPGQWGEFEFPITAPNTAGSYNEHFNLVAQGITWFNDPGQTFPITVN